jgi:hypothetical protein
MGQRLTEFYEQASKLGGVKAKMRMAMITKISSNAAGSAPDSPENINNFKKALEEIKKEFA